MAKPKPAAPVSEVPVSEVPASEVPAAPVSEVPVSEVPVSEVPAAPVSEVPAAPVSEVTDVTTYVCTRHVSHDNADYEAGDPIELTGRQAEALLDVGAIEVKASE